MANNNKFARLSQDSINKILTIENGTERRVALALYAYFHFCNEKINISKIQKDFNVKVNNNPDGITTHIKNVLRFFKDNDIVKINLNLKYYTSRTYFNVEVENDGNCTVQRSCINKIFDYGSHCEERLNFKLLSFYVFVVSLITRNDNKGFSYMRIHPKSSKELKRKSVTQAEDGNNIMQLLKLSDRRIKDIMHTLKFLGIINYTYYSASDYNADSGIHIATPYFFYFDEAGKEKADKYIANIYRDKGAKVFIDNLNNKVFRFYNGVDNSWNKNNFGLKIAIGKVVETNNLIYCDAERKQKNNFNEITNYEFLYKITDTECKHTRRGNRYITYYEDELTEATYKLKGNKPDFFSRKHKKRIHPFVHIDSKAECLIQLFKDKLSQKELSNDEPYKNLKDKFEHAEWTSNQFEKMGEWIQSRRNTENDYDYVSKRWSKTPTEKFLETMENYIQKPLYLRASTTVTNHVVQAFNIIVKSRLFDYFFVKTNKDAYDKDGKKVSAYKIKDNLIEACWKRLWSCLQYLLRFKFDLAEQFGMIKDGYSNTFKLYAIQSKNIKEKEFINRPVQRMMDTLNEFIKDFPKAMKMTNNRQYAIDERTKEEYKLTLQKEEERMFKESCQMEESGQTSEYMKNYLHAMGTPENVAVCC